MNKNTPVKRAKSTALGKKCNPSRGLTKHRKGNPSIIPSLNLQNVKKKKKKKKKKKMSAAHAWLFALRLNFTNKLVYCFLYGLFQF